MNKLLVTLVILSLLVLNVQYVDAKKKNKHDGGVEPQEPHYKNGEHNAKGHHQGKWKREDDDDDDEDEKESEDNEEIDEELKECPVFKKAHGCPFAHTHDAGVDYDPAKIKGCPAFGEGCPYAQGNEDLLEKVKGCPAFKGGHCPFTDKEVDMDKIKECPAFKSGCPYDTAHSPHHALHHAHHHGHHGGHHHGYFHALSGKKGCPYSGMEINQISNCPAFKNGCPFDSNGRIDMEKIKECPIFKEGCPFDFSQETELTSLCPFFQTNARKTKAQEFVNLYFGIGFEEASFDALLAEHFTYLAVTDVIPQNRGTALTLETLKTTMTTVRKNFASTITFEDVVAEGNTVVVHATVEATSAEAIDGLSGISPSKTGSTRGVWIVHFTSDEKIGSVTTLLDIESFRSHYQQ